jgi:DNA-binding MarR family transcriptional regulator
VAPRRKLASDAWGALLQVHAKLLPAIDGAVRTQTRLPLSWYDVLLELSAHPDGRLRMSELGERVVLSRTRVSRVVDQLVDGGLVDKMENPHDGRSAYAVITKAGRAEFKAAAPVYVRAIEEQFAAALSNTELAQLANILNKVRAPQPGHAD